MDTAIGIGGLVAGFAAALFSLLAWLAARQREPFTLSEKRDGIAKLTRTKRPAVQLGGAHVHGVSPIISRDNAGTLYYRQMGRGQSIILAVENIPPGEVVIVRYRHIRPFDALTIRGKATAAKKAKRQARREQLDNDHNAWKIWTGHLM